MYLGFPNQAVYDAYQTPKIDYDQSKFTWAMPQLELLREYTTNYLSSIPQSFISSRFIGSKLKWDRRKIDDMILPVIKRINTKEVRFSF